MCGKIFCCTRHLSHYQHKQHLFLFFASPCQFSWKKSRVSCHNYKETCFYTNIRLMITRLTMLNLIVWFLFLLKTAKKYHCVYPLVLMSFCSIKSNWFCPVFIIYFVPGKQQISSLTLIRLRILVLQSQSSRVCYSAFPQNH